MHRSSVSVLSVFAVLVFVWTLLELSCLDKWLRYTFSFYPTVLWCMIGLGVQHFLIWSPIFILCVLIGLFVVISLVIRIPLVVWRSFTNPMYMDPVFNTGISSNTWPKKEYLTTAL